MTVFFRRPSASGRSLSTNSLTTYASLCAPMDSATRSAIDLANVRTSEVSAERSPSAVVSLLRRKLFEPIARELPRAVLLGHWTQRECRYLKHTSPNTGERRLADPRPTGMGNTTGSWDVTGEAIRQDCCLPVARVTDLHDAVTVLNALLPPADILVSYYLPEKPRKLPR